MSIQIVSPFLLTQDLEGRKLSHLFASVWAYLDLGLNLDSFACWHHDMTKYLVLPRLFPLGNDGSGGSVFGKHIRLVILQVICENTVCIKCLPLTCLPHYPMLSE